MSNFILNKLFCLSPSAPRKLSSKLMVSFVALTALLGTPDAYCMKEGDETSSSTTTPTLKTTHEDDLSLDQVVPAETLTHILSFLPSQELITTNRLVSHYWGDIALEATRGKTLELSEKKPTTEQLTALGKIPFSGLILSGCTLDGSAASIIANFEHLKLLDLAGNNIEDEGAKALANGKFKNLNSLNLSSNDIEDEGAEALAEAMAIGNFPHLTSLDLQINAIGNKGAEALGHLENLTSLNLGSNFIGNEGAKALGRLTNLTSLDLEWNNIGDEGATELMGLTKLTSLNLASNPINNDTKEILKTQLESIKDLGL